MPAQKNKQPKQQTDMRQGIKSVEIGLRVVQVFLEVRAPMSLKEISAAVQLPPSNTHRYLTSLSRTGLVRQVHGNQYDLGPLALKLGFAVLNRLDPINCCSEWMRLFSGKTGTTSMLTIMSDRGPVVVRWVQGVRPVFTTITVGSVLPMLKSATGNVFLTYADPMIVKHCLKLDPNVSVTRQKKEIENIRQEVKQGELAAVTGDLISELSAMASPVFNGYGDLEAVITAVSADKEISPDTIEELKASTRKASLNLGWHPG